jgi:hypothetical protein
MSPIWMSGPASLATPPGLRVLHEAVRMLRSIDLEADYAAAWHEWDSTGEREEWQSTSGDGLR